MRIHVTESIEESKMFNRRKHGAIIIAGSGMCDGGRVKHHLSNNLGRPECAILFGGFQARGTVGRRIVDRSEWVRIYGERIDVRASVHTLGGLSAHADRDGLLGWLRGFAVPPEMTYAVRGERETALGFAATIEQTLGWSARAPAARERVKL